MEDIDGVIYPYTSSSPDVEHDTGAFAVACSGLSGRPITDFAPAKTWNFNSDQWGIPNSEFMEYMREAVLQHDLFCCKAPFEGAAVAGTYLRSLGCEIHLVTNRAIPGAEKEAEQQTRDWLSDWGIPYDRLIISKYKVMNGYAGYAWSIDDNKENYDTLDEARCNPYLLDRPWNVGHPGRRVFTLMEFVDVVRKDLGL